MVASAARLGDDHYDAQLNTENGGVGNFGNWIGGQLIMAAIGLIWVWLCGLRFLWRSDRPL